ncbi:uncharacterized protein [Aristolochia californica]|uniref:uncharacterized protein n=1 Tax=Aristolochia californica TaxID=171875 RepID=UPI0035D8A17B
MSLNFSWTKLSTFTAYRSPLPVTEKKLAFSSTYHPQTDGQTKIFNRTIEITRHDTLQGFGGMRRYAPPSPCSFSRSSNYNENNYHKCHRDLAFALGYHVWLCLQHYRQLPLTASKHHKLSPKFYGPFQVLDSIGSVAYRLQLPQDAKILDVFHVSLLKSFKGDTPMYHTPLPPLQEGCVLPTPAQVLLARHVQGSWEILVQWADTEPMETSWEPLEAFQALYPTYELEDKLFL